MSIHPNSLENLKKSNGFADHPENINRNGRPRKLTTDILEDLESNGIQGVSAKQVQSIIEVMLNCTKTQLETYAGAKGQPYVINVMAQHLLDSKGSTKVLDSILDRAHGKATQRQEIRVGAAPPQSLDELYEAETDDEWSSKLL